ncbi:GAF domain-containing protein [Geojedonia litorea]|uniref:GAF domain-containing protein n=1 Tax=Geojedonia litorea TaxID=1268269 RepID=A0ABV9N624_9FLAO
MVNHIENINDTIESPFKLEISFNKLLQYYEKLAKSEDEFLAAKAKRVLKAQRPYPILRDGFVDTSILSKYKKEVDIILQDSFSQVLTKNEIKTASMPFHDFAFNASYRFGKILEAAGKDFTLEIKNISDYDLYRSACVVILNFYYGYEVNFKRPFFYEIPDANGVMRYYKILYNADFIEILPTEKTPKITQQDFEDLLDNFDDMDLWKKKFPPKSYRFKGFVISNIFDVTDDQSISNIKSTLIVENSDKKEMAIHEFNKVFRSLLNVKDIKVGFSAYNEEDDEFEHVFGKGVESFLLKSSEPQPCRNVLCGHSYEFLLKDKKLLSISDVDKYFETSKGKMPHIKLLKEQGIKSAILAPIADNNKLLGILELVSNKPKALNSINANRLLDVMPFIVSSVIRSKKEERNLIEAVIQQECTSIHPSVSWKFNIAARKFIRDKQIHGNNAVFSKIKFDNVYPLFGQIDVKGSSDARNFATQKDLALQLNLVEKIIDELIELEQLPIYQKLKFQLENYLSELKNNFKVDSEQHIANFLKQDIEPLFKFQVEKHPSLKDAIEDYFSKIDDNLDVIYYYRKNYDDTIVLINENMSSILDAKQKEAQSMYPHYFERFKTDGVEHNMYIGESITKKDSFNTIYLYNLRLWQLQVMCEMENDLYRNQHEYPIALDVASMILVFNQPLSIRFRMDEKQFDVDGTYNARYEVVKKRVDKAFIKGTEDRITTKGKMVIVYSQKEDEAEYLQYIKFLQSKNRLNDDVEIVELEDLQGVTGLKAIRVGLLYSTDPERKDYYTYEDLINEIET